MTHGNPTHEQMCQVIGSIYSDAYLRIQSLENENKILREDQQKFVVSAKKVQDELREENQRLKHEIEDIRKTQSWNNGKGNSMFPESLRRKLDSELTEPSSISLPPQGNNGTPPPKSIATPDEMQN